MLDTKDVFREAHEAFELNKATGNIIDGLAEMIIDYHNENLENLDEEEKERLERLIELNRESKSKKENPKYFINDFGDYGDYHIKTVNPDVYMASLLALGELLKDFAKEIVERMQFIAESDKDFEIPVAELDALFEAVNEIVRQESLVFGTFVHDKDSYEKTINAMADTYGDERPFKDNGSIFSEDEENEK